MGGEAKRRRAYESHTLGRLAAAGMTVEDQRIKPFGTDRPSWIATCKRCHCKWLLPIRSGTIHEVALEAALNHSGCEAVDE